jgi:transcriptional regulator with XRE-family HTH domain
MTGTAADRRRIMAEAVAAEAEIIEWTGSDLARTCACVGPQSTCTRCESDFAHRGSVPDDEREFLAAGFGAELKRLRLAAALSQTRLGELAGLRGDHVGRLERGKRRPTIAAVKTLCRIIAPEAEREAVESRLATLAGASLREGAFRRKQARDNKHRRAALASAMKAHRTMKSALRDAERRGEVTSGSLRNLADRLGETVDRLRAETTTEPAGIKGITPRDSRPRRFDRPRSRSLKDLEAWLDASKELEEGED